TIDFGIDRGATSGIFSVHMLLACVIAIVGGWATDKYGPRKICGRIAIIVAVASMVAEPVSCVRYHASAKLTTELPRREAAWLIQITINFFICFL
ncbi:MAG: hypothetical protein JSU58_07740, partial [Dehalococcoidales bacterium]